MAALGHEASIAYVPRPTADPAMLIDDTVEYPVQVNGKARSHIIGRRRRRSGGRGSSRARRPQDPGVLEGGCHPQKVIVVPVAMVNLVT